MVTAIDRGLCDFVLGATLVDLIGIGVFQGWLDTLRIEMYTYNIHVTSVCPGPVFSEALVHAFTDKVDKVGGLCIILTFRNYYL